MNNKVFVKSGLGVTWIVKTVNIGSSSVVGENSVIVCDPSSQI